MKVCCPHCSFKFDTDEEMIPPFKNRQRVRFVKSKIKKESFGYLAKNFNFTGVVVNQKLVRKEDQYLPKMKPKDRWLINVSYVPCGNRNGEQHHEFWDFQLKKISKK